MRFGVSLATKCVSLSNEPYMTRRTLIDSNSFELHCYPFMINVDKSNKSYNVVDDLSTEICDPSKTKDVNIKVFNIITKICEAKTLVKHI